MKPIFTKTLKTCLLVLLTGLFSQGIACDRSSIQLDSLVSSGGNYDIYITQLVGGGVTGAVRGASNSTFTFAYAFYGAPTLGFSFFTPSLTADSTGVTNPGANFGPAFGSVFTIGYVSTGNAYACINSTAICGNAHADVKQVHFTVDQVPDSIRLFGIEGAGNPLSGCYPNIDMLVDFTILPVVWADFHGNPVQNGIELDWATSQETNTADFRVMRSADGVVFEEIGELAAAGNSEHLEEYSFTDHNPHSGTNFYRIVQLDKDGRQSQSSVLQLEFDQELAFGWTHVAPNPVSDRLQVGFMSVDEADFDLQVFNLNGSLQLQQQINAAQGSNVVDLEVNDLAPGVYFVRLSGNQGKLDKKIIKI